MFPPRLPTHNSFFTAMPRTSVLRRPLLSLRQPRVKPRPTVPKSRLRLRLYLSCLPFLTLARLPLSRQISFRQGRAGGQRQAADAGSSRPAVDYGFSRPNPAPPPAKQPVTTARLPRRPRLPSPSHERPARPIDSVPTASIGYAAAATELVPPLLGVQSSDGTPTPFPERPTPAELEFREAVECYSHDDWARTTRRTSLRCRHSVPPAREPCGPPQRFSLSYSISQTAPSVSGCCSLADKGRLRRDNDRTLPLARKSTPTSVDGLVTSSGRAAHLVNGESSTQIYVPLLMRPWIMLSLIHI